MALSKEFRGEVADALVMWVLNKKGVHLNLEELKEKIPMIAEGTGIPIRDIMEYVMETTAEASRLIFKELHEFTDELPNTQRA